MAITQEAREDIITLIVGMFNAAPGAHILNQLVAAHEAGMTIPAMAEVLSTKPQFIEVYPTHQTSAEFAASLVDNLLTEATPVAAQTWATNWVVTQLNGGATRAEVIIEALAALRATTNENYADAQAQLENRVEVATYYSVNQQQSSTDLGVLQAVLTDVTGDDDTVDEAKAEIDEEAGLNGQVFTLTTSPDTIEGTSANDTIRALNNGTDVLNAFDDIDGGAGTDTLNIYTKAGVNLTLPALASIENVEIVNVYNDGAVGSFGDASLFQGIEQLWQSADADAVTNLQTSTTAGFRSIAAGALSVEADTGAASATIALDNVADDTTLAVSGESTHLNTVNLSGTVVSAAPPAAVAPLALAMTVGNGQATAFLNSSVAVTATIAGNAALKNYDATGSTAAVNTTGGAAIQSIKTGTGNDTVGIATATTATVAGTVETGAGNDTVNISTTGTGAVTVTTGAGKDTVNVTVAAANTGLTTISTGDDDDTVNVLANAGKLDINLGAGNDTFNATVAIDALDSIDAGDGTDTLLLSLVGVANVGAFKNFDVYDVKGMSTNLDLKILDQNNTVTEIVGSGALAGDTQLQNIGSGVNFRATKDMGVADDLILTQAAAGALTVTLDADETGVADAGDDVASVAVVASNATSVSAVFDTSYLGKAGAVVGETAADDNLSTMQLVTNAATTLTVVSGGDNSQNVLELSDNGNKLATVTVTGAQSLDLTTTTTTALTSINASGHTGGLTVSLDALKNGGTLTLGSGTDVVEVSNTSTNVGGTANIEKVTAFEKTAAVSVSVLPADATAKAAAIASADKLDFGAATSVADANGGVTTGTIANGKLTFTGAGPATLDAAIDIANDAADAVGEAVVFEYIGNSYVFVQNAGDDIVTQLVGITGVTNLAETATDGQFFIV